MEKLRTSNARMLRVFESERTCMHEIFAGKYIEYIFLPDSKCVGDGGEELITRNRIGYSAHRYASHHNATRFA